jgi:hydrogenase nickel incorporation protein HypA/HybF
MHELSIALSIVEMAQQECAQRGGVRLRAVHLRMGPLAGIVPDALRFSYIAACAETSLEGSQLLIEEVPLTVHCPTCHGPHQLARIYPLRCPACGSDQVDIVQGKELEVVALEVEE